MSSFEQKNELYQKLNSICDVLRKTMDASEYRNYILGFIFYKYLSDKFLKFVNQQLKNDNISFFDADQKILKYLEELSVKKLGYFIKKEFLFESWINNIKNKDGGITNLVQSSLKDIEIESEKWNTTNNFKGLFDDISFESSKLGNNPKEKERNISHVLIELSKINLDFENKEIDILGDAYEFLIANFASESGKKAGEFYTPQEVSKVLAQIVTYNKTQLRNVYDPTCGSGSLLLQVSNQKNIEDIGTIYGQEAKSTTYNLARMNMFLHGKNYSEFDIKHGDTILEPMHLGKKFEAIVANPPFSLPWEHSSELESDERFSEYGVLAPKSKMDYAFIQHMLYHLADNGVMATIVPHGVLFRGGAEEKIRTYIIKNKNWLDAVIGLPANIFFGTSIPSCIMVFKKNRKPEDKILFIEASREFEKGKNQNKLSNDNINKIIDTYGNRKEIEKYSRLVELKEIQENEYNLNITRYVDTFEEEEEININKVNEELKQINKEIEETEKEIQAMIAELVETK